VICDVVNCFLIASAASAYNRALVARTTDTTGTLNWDSEAYDGNSIHDPSTNPDRLTTPSGVSLARVIGDYLISTANFVEIKKNGASFAGASADVTVTAGNNGGNLITAISPVSAGDYFTLTTAATIIRGDPVTWMAFEEIPSSTKYAVVQKSANQALAAGTTTTLTWNTELADTDGFHDNVTNNSRLTVPSGVTLVRVTASMEANTGASGQGVLSCTKNGASFAGKFIKDDEAGGLVRMSAASAIVAVSAGDYFEAQGFVTSANNVLAGDHTWFQIEAITAATRYAVVSKSAAQAFAASTTTVMAFGAEVADTDGSHDNVTNNSRLTVPSGLGITRARLSFNIVTASATGQAVCEVFKNGSRVPGLPHDECDTAGTDNVGAFGAWVDVVPGDYFELTGFFASAQSIGANDGTWFCIEFA
jgi:hypothetical protein